MEAFHNDPSIKEEYITRLNEHYQADQIIKGQYWANGKGCAVGCTIHSGDHNKYELELGIPEDIAHLQDSIFEGLPNKLAKQFPLEFLSSINVGADLKNVSKLFMIWMLTDEKYGVMQYVEDKKIVQEVADAISKDMISPVPFKEWEELRKNANAASADTNVSYSSDNYATAYYTAAYYAAYSASDSVACSYSAVAYSAAAVAYSVKNIKSEWYIAASNKLIELLKNSN